LLGLHWGMTPKQLLSKSTYCPTRQLPTPLALAGLSR